MMACCLAIVVAASAIIGVIAGLLLGRFQPGGWLAFVIGPCFGVLVIFGRRLWPDRDTEDDESPTDDAPIAPPPPQIEPPGQIEIQDQGQLGAGTRDSDTDLPPRVGDPS